MSIREVLFAVGALTTATLVLMAVGKIFFRNPADRRSCRARSWQLGDIHRDPPRLVAREQLGRLIAGRGECRLLAVS
jgi:hypothetical protein